MVEKVTVMKQKGESLSNYVSELIEREDRARATGVAIRYQEFLSENPGERAALEVWESALLANDAYLC